MLCLPKAELNTKNSTKRQLCCHLVEFLVFNSIGQLISLPSDEVYRVGDGDPDHAVVLHIGSQFDLFLSYTSPRSTFFDFNLSAVSFHFWSPKFCVPCGGISFYGVPIWSLLFYISHRELFLGFNLLPVSAHFWPLKFFKLTDVWWMVGWFAQKIMFFSDIS